MSQAVFIGQLTRSWLTTQGPHSRLLHAQPCLGHGRPCKDMGTLIEAAIPWLPAERWLLTKHNKKPRTKVYIPGGLHEQVAMRANATLPPSRIPISRRAHKGVEDMCNSTFQAEAQAKDRRSRPPKAAAASRQFPSDGFVSIRVEKAPEKQSRRRHDPSHLLTVSLAQAIAKAVSSRSITRSTAWHIRSRHPLVAGSNMPWTWDSTLNSGSSLERQGQGEGGRG